MADYRFCTVEDEGRVRIVTLNRPEVLNALHADANANSPRCGTSSPRATISGSASSPAPASARSPPATT